MIRIEPDKHRDGRKDTHADETDVKLFTRRDRGQQRLEGKSWHFFDVFHFDCAGKRGSLFGLFLSAVSYSSRMDGIGDGDVSPTFYTVESCTYLCLCCWHTLTNTGPSGQESDLGCIHQPFPPDHDQKSLNVAEATQPRLRNCQLHTQFIKRSGGERVGSPVGCDWRHGLDEIAGPDHSCFKGRAIASI